jgi:putative endonuclease
MAHSNPPAADKSHQLPLCCHDIAMVTVYVLRSLTTGKRYIGITNNFIRRMSDHRRTTSTVNKLLGAFEVLQTEEFPNYIQARAREKFLKSGQGRAWLDVDFQPDRVDVAMDWPANLSPGEKHSCLVLLVAAS